MAEHKTVNTDWRRSLPAEWTVPCTGEDGGCRDIPLREHPALAKYASKDEAVKALVHAQRMLGRRPEGYVRVPESGEDADQWEELWTALGRPESPDKYAMPELELPEGMAVDESFLAEFAQTAHGLGLSSDQAAGLYGWFVPRVVELDRETGQAAEELRHSEFEALRGQHMGRTSDVLERALQSARAIGGDGLVQALDETGAGDRAAVISAFARLAPLVLEGRFRNERAASGVPLDRAQLEAMMRDPRYHDPLERDPEWVRRIEEGFQTLYPGAKKR
ncbi:hypothetical protein [Pseudodesulfovibrio senegalensis]|jgi:hypothetical protein|uniref:Uncharacterized protein n=1 Tax=Pseudodesulfovibrio senegalensis TaxID=1721087 RepID=A0A6N6N2L4_9BACT|nr:hypothetical protein [Pseudodesulfovibrio senegalensis]KAB1441655.1 hypothetical protein F8A88_08625 [Pseudodesulfovibrio senegalensis]